MQLHATQRQLASDWRPPLRQPRHVRKGKFDDPHNNAGRPVTTCAGAKLSHPAPPHPGSVPQDLKGKKYKESQKPLRVGASQGEVGRVSQEGKVAQARKDHGDR